MLQIEAKMERSQGESRLLGSNPRRAICFLVLLTMIQLATNRLQLVGVKPNISKATFSVFNGSEFSADAKGETELSNTPKHENFSVSPAEAIAFNGSQSSVDTHRENESSVVPKQGYFTVSPPKALVFNGSQSPASMQREIESPVITKNFTASRAEPDSSCGWNTTKKATWMANTNEENRLFWNNFKCQQRLFPKKNETWDKSQRPPPSSLQCGDNIMEEFNSILSHYEKIVFLGDSLQRQLFFTLSCMMNSSLLLKDIVTAKTVRSSFEWTHESSNTFVMFRMLPRALHKSDIFNSSILDSNPRHALIVSLGAHYYPHKIHRAKDLEDDTRSIAEIAQQTNTSVFWVDTIDFQWPTSNGEFVSKCWECKCEALTPGRIMGTGEFTGPDRYRSNPRYPSIDVPVPPNHSLPCIPYCLPANWRNQASNGVLEDPKYSAIQLVPTWHQLVSSGFPQSRFSYGDCTHKSTDALIAMAQQLLRALLRKMSKDSIR